MFVRFIYTGGITDHHCLHFDFILATYIHRHQDRNILSQTWTLQ